MNNKFILRAAEWVGLGLFTVYMLFLAQGVVVGFSIFNFSVLTIVLLCVTSFAAYVAADFASGFVHFLGDNFGSETTPFFGPKFIHPFREHHIDPKAMTKHNFVHTNGNNCLISLVLLLPVYYFLPAATSLFNFFASVFAFFLLLAVFLTNQFHAWAHADRVPNIIAWLQKKRLILSPGHHSLHHTSPFDTYYCITSGWLNNILERSGFFESIVRLVRNNRQKLKT